MTPWLASHAPTGRSGSLRSGAPLHEWLPIVLPMLNEPANSQAYRLLQDVLPIELLAAPAGESDRPTSYRPELTAIGRFHPIFRFSPDEADNAAVWNKLSEIYWWAEGYRPKPAAEVLKD